MNCTSQIARMCRLHWCAVWSAPLLFACSIYRFSHDVAHIRFIKISLFYIHVHTYYKIHLYNIIEYEKLMMLFFPTFAYRRQAFSSRKKLLSHLTMWQLSHMSKLKCLISPKIALFDWGNRAQITNCHLSEAKIYLLTWRHKIAVTWFSSNWTFMMSEAKKDLSFAFYSKTNNLIAF